jgi:hypothetical protein
MAFAYGAAAPYFGMRGAHGVPYNQYSFYGPGTVGAEGAYVRGGYAFPQAAPTALTGCPHRQTGMMACENRTIEVSYMNPWTDDMYKRLVLLKNPFEGNLQLDWIAIAADINTLFKVNVTPASCEWEYNDLIKKFEICQEVMTYISTKIQQGSAKVQKNTKKPAQTKESLETFRSKMEWDEEKNKRLQQVVEKWKAQNPENYWDNVTKEMNEEFNEKRDKECYERKYRKLSKGIEDGNITPDQESHVKTELQNGKYYKFSQEGIFEGVAYTAVGALIKKTHNAIEKLLSRKSSKKDPFLKKLHAIERRRVEGEFISKEALYTLLGEFAPKAEVVALEPSVT